MSRSMAAEATGCPARSAPAVDNNRHVDNAPRPPPMCYEGGNGRGAGPRRPQGSWRLHGAGRARGGR
ncbi:hypothetical protein GCM10012279_37350 [Micromonospora yangpuensis]|nr:hypothetical protein GCM10012279_37350 [Micromonospora yangpuensis]